MGFNWSRQHFSFTLVTPVCCSLHLDPSVQRTLFILYSGSSPHDCPADAVISFLWKPQLATGLLERIASMYHPLGRLVKGTSSMSSSSSVRNGWSRPALWVIRLWQTASGAGCIYSDPPQVLAWPQTEWAIFWGPESRIPTHSHGETQMFAESHSGANVGSRRENSEFPGITGSLQDHGM